MASIMILIPLFGVVALNLLFANTDKMKKAAFWFAMFVFIVQTVAAVFQHPAVQGKLFGNVDSFLKMNFYIDHLSCLMFLCIGIVSLSALIVARYTITENNGRFKFINLLILTSIGMNGIVMVRDVFSLYVFMEVTAISSFLLIAFPKTLDSLEGSFKYLVLSAVATALMLTSVAILLLISGSTSFDVLAAAVNQSQNSALIVFALGLFICALFIKGGLVPFHGWLPDAYSAAPAPVSILLAGVITKAAGIYTMIRIVTSIFAFDYRIQGVLMLISIISIFVGALVAIGQDNFKRMLSYSSISQVGYIILGLSVGTPLGIMGAAFHLFNHAIFKTLLFVNSASVEKETGTCDMNKMGGIARKMPVTGATSVIAFLSTAGIPPLSGFWSKAMIVIALWQIGRYGYAALAVFAGLITLAYFLSMQRRVFFGKLRPGLEDLKEVNKPVAALSIFLAAITIAAGVFFPVFFNALIEPIKEIMGR